MHKNALFQVSAAVYLSFLKVQSVRIVPAVLEHCQGGVKLMDSNRPGKALVLLHPTLKCQKGI